MSWILGKRQDGFELMVIHLLFLFFFFLSFNSFFFSRSKWGIP